MKPRGIVILVVATVLAVALGSAPAWSSSTNANAPHTVRFESTKAQHWAVGCEDAGCVGSLLMKAKVESPSSQRMDVVVTATMDYRTSTDGAVAIRGTYRGAGRNGILSPGPWVLTSPSQGRFTTTTMTWVKRLLPAAGREYTFRLEAAPRPGEATEMFARGRKVALSIDMRPSAE